LLGIGKNHIFQVELENSLEKKSLQINWFAFSQTNQQFLHIPPLKSQNVPMC
jgi:hypothetical protein